MQVKWTDYTLIHSAISNSGSWNPLCDPLPTCFAAEHIVIRLLTCKDRGSHRSRWRTTLIQGLIIIMTRTEIGEPPPCQMCNLGPLTWRVSKQIIQVINPKTGHKQTQYWIIPNVLFNNYGIIHNNGFSSALFSHSTIMHGALEKASLSTRK